MCTCRGLEEGRLSLEPVSLEQIKERSDSANPFKGEDFDYKCDREGSKEEVTSGKWQATWETATRSVWLRGSLIPGVL